MAINETNIGPILDDFIREFYCDPVDREELCMVLTEKNALLKVDAAYEIECVRKKLAKRSERRAAQFADIVRQLQSQPDLQNGNELILFFIAYAAAHQYETKTVRDAKLAMANANRSNDLMTPVCRQRVTKFALSHSTTPSSSDSAQTFFRAKHTPVLPSPTPLLLTGRAAGPSVVCEEELVRHALMALQGIEGIYIELGTDRLAFQLSGALAVDDLLKAQLLRLLPIANAYLHLRHECQKSKPDLLARAFCAGLSQVLASYMTLVSELYTKFMCDPESLNCLELLLALSNWEMLFPLLSNLISNCKDRKGMRIFNTVFSLSSTTASHFLQQFLQILLQPMVCIFHECLSSWLLHGQLTNSDFEWMIEKRRKLGFHDSWANDYKIVNNAAPAIFEHFEGLKEKILIVGKTVALLETMGVEDDDMPERRRIFSSVDPSKCYLQISEGHRLWHAIRKLSYHISGKVSQNIVKRYNIYAHFLAVQQHYLLDDECFTLTFYEKLKEEAAGYHLLALDSQQASQALHSAVELCKSWPKEIEQFAKIEATCGLMVELDDVGASRIIATPRDQSGCATIRLIYDAKIPISVVLNESVMRRYDKAFEFIWLLNCTDFELTASLLDHHLFMKNEPLSDAMLIVNIFTVVFTRMSQLLSSIRFYVSYSVVARLQTVLLSEMDCVSGDIIGIMEAHERYFAHLEEGLFLNDEGEVLRNLLFAFLALVRDLLVYYSSFRLEMRDMIESRARFNKLEKDVAGKDLQNTEFFEKEEEKIRLEELQQHLEEHYRPKIKTLNSKFVLLVRDIMEILMALPHKPHYADLALLLDFTGYYRQCLS